MGVKWLLEDSLEHLQETVKWNNTYCVNMLNLLITWLEWNKKEKLSDIRYNLGLFVVREGKISFYYTQQYDFYLDSLKKFHIVSQAEEFNEEIKSNNTVVEFWIKSCGARARLRGTLTVVNDQQERIKALKKLAEEGEIKLSPNFLPAHGFKKENGWSSLTPLNTSLVVIKLENITQEIGLKSP